MGDHEPQHHLEGEKREYSFDEGVQEALTRIQKLLESQDYVVVQITGSGTAVGKTHLDGALGRSLDKQGIPNVSVSNETLIFEHTKQNLEDEQKQRRNTKGVIVLSAAGMFTDWGGRAHSITQEESQKIRAMEDRDVQQYAQSAGIQVSKIDLRIFIHRADKQFGKEALRLADIVIRNEKAKDDR